MVSPVKFVTDNGPQYSSAAFREFSHTYGFTHVTSSPLYPQSNGLSERTVQTVKNVLQKCKESGQDPHLAMLCVRSTPLSHDLPSPAKLLNGRMYQTNLPGVSKPSSSSNGDVNAKLQLRQDKQKAQYDKTAKQPIQPLFAEDCVRIHNPANNRWTQVWFTVWLMHPSLTWWLIALVEYSEETVATYEGLMRPLNFQFLQKKSLRIFQLVTHILKSWWPAVPLHHLTVLSLPLLVKQILLLLQFLLLCADQLGEFKLQRDWTYDCMHCLVFFLYYKLEQFNISKPSSFLSFPQKEGDVVLLSGLQFSTIDPGHHVC